MKTFWIEIEVPTGWRGRTKEKVKIGVTASSKKEAKQKVIEKITESLKTVK